MDQLAPENRDQFKKAMHAATALLFCIAVAALVVAVLALIRTNSTDLTISSIKGVKGMITLTDALIYAGDDTVANQLGSTNFTSDLQLAGNPVPYVLASKVPAIMSSDIVNATDIFSGTMTLPSVFDTTGMVVIQVQGELSATPAAGTKALNLVVGTNTAITVMTTTSVVPSLPFRVTITIGSYVDTAANTWLYVSYTNSSNGVITQGDAVGLAVWAVGQTIAVTMAATAAAGDLVCFTGNAIAYPAMTS